MDKPVERVLRCNCAWRKAGLGAEVSIPNSDCDIHGATGPMPMFARFEDQTARQAGVLARKHADPAGQITTEEGLYRFASGASSSGRLPNYAGMMPKFAFDRLAAHRGFGDAKHGEDNYLKGARDRQFILDRINHGIAHLLALSAQVKTGNPGSNVPGEDDAAAVMCAGMFVMCWQEARREDQRTDESTYMTAKEAMRAYEERKDRP